MVDLLVHRRSTARRPTVQDNNSKNTCKNDEVRILPTKAVPAPPAAIMTSCRNGNRRRNVMDSKCMPKFRVMRRRDLLALLVIACLLLRLLFGPRGSPMGGPLGIFVDCQLRNYLLWLQTKIWMDHLEQEGIVLPQSSNSFINLQSQLRSMPNFAVGVALQHLSNRKRGILGEMQNENRSGAGDPVALSKWIAKSNNVHVTMTENSNVPSLNLVPKVSIQKQLRERLWCEQSWLCFRCLKAPIYGSYSKCSLVCGTCAKDIICNTPYDLEKTTVEMTMRIDAAASSSTSDWLIPRIIHQTWFEDITPERYPQLARLQNSWKNSGWEYRFYDDSAVEKYIKTHFPRRFLFAYQSLTPGAYKADFFRYLVLMKDGGIYADMDLLLETNLDTFITPNMGFFAPVDTVGSQVGEPFCLWNGFTGSAPGHPFLIQAVERMLNLVLNRADIYDMERDLCQNEQFKGETWKARVEPNLLLSGPCALGIAVNEAMGNDPVASFTDIGWASAASSKSKANIPGDTLILALDKNDLGSLRLSEIERNFIVASTDMPGLSKTPVVPASKEKNRLGNRPPHYSLAGKGNWLWGTKYVYADLLTANEIIKINVVDG